MGISQKGDCIHLQQKTSYEHVDGRSFKFSGALRDSSNNRRFETNQFLRKFDSKMFLKYEI